MKPFRLPLLALLGAALLAAVPAAWSQVLPPARRAAALEAAQAYVAQRDAALPPKLANPFFPASFGGNQAEAIPSGPGEATLDPIPRPTGPRNDRDLLATLAGAIRPSGYFIIGGEPTLVFGQKRVKAGDPLTINFEGTDYTLTVTAIDRTSFTLRLNREEFTRPIK